MFEVLQLYLPACIMLYEEATRHLVECKLLFNNSLVILFLYFVREVQLQCGLFHLLMDSLQHIK